RAVEPHANDAIGVIDADRARRDVHRAGTGTGSGSVSRRSLSKPPGRWTTILRMRGLLSSRAGPWQSVCEGVGLWVRSPFLVRSPSGGARGKRRIVCGKDENFARLMLIFARLWAVAFRRRAARPDGNPLRAPHACSLRDSG